MSWINNTLNKEVLGILHELLDEFEIAHDTDFYDAKVKSAKDQITDLIEHEQDEWFEEGKEEGKNET